LFALSSPKIGQASPSTGRSRPSTLSMQIEAHFTPDFVPYQVVADFHIGDRGVGVETDAHLLHGLA
ncbi:MAG TPA: hypothetical protein VIM71_04035, partial [Lacunisphaera sp.]